jgi:hypothetical protein
LTQFFLESSDAPAFSLPRHNSSRQLPSELPADLNARIVWVWRGSVVPPLHPHYNSPYTTPRCHPLGRAARGDHCRDQPQGVHSCGRHTWHPQMPRQTARPRSDSLAKCHPPRQSSCFPAGLVLGPAGFFTIAAEAAKNPPGYCFTPTRREVFACSGLAAPSQPPQRQYPQRQRKLPLRIDL